MSVDDEPLARDHRSWAHGDQCSGDLMGPCIDLSFVRGTCEGGELARVLSRDGGLRSPQDVCDLLLGPPIRSQFTSDLHLPPPEPSVPVPSEHDRPQTPNLFNSPQFQCILHFEILSVG